MQASLRRGVSAAYYAIFHMLVDEAVNRMIAAPRHPIRNCLRRAFSHSNMNTVAQQFATDSVSPKLSPGLNGQPLPPKLMQVAEAFVDLQQARHEADYTIRLSDSRAGTFLT